MAPPARELANQALRFRIRGQFQREASVRDRRDGARPARQRACGVVAQVRDHQLPALQLERHQVADATARHHPALRHDPDPAAQRFGVRQDVRAEEHGAAALAQLEDQIAHLAPAERIEAGHRFVEEDHFGIVDQRLREPDALQQALRELAQPHPPLPCHPDFIEHARDAGAHVGAGIAEQPREIREHFFRGQVVVVIRVLGEKADASPHLEITDGTPKDLRAAAARINQLHQQLERRALAGAVRPEKTKHLAGLHLERQRIERAVRTRPPESNEVILAKSFSLDRCRHVLRAVYLPPACSRFSSQAIAASKNSGFMPGSLMPFTKNVGVPLIFNCCPWAISAFTSARVAA